MESNRAVRCVRVALSGINLGSGDLCAQAILGNPAFDSSVLVIGLHLADQEKSAAAGGIEEGAASREQRRVGHGDDDTPR